jgi:hypothetical protein
MVSTLVEFGTDLWICRHCGREVVELPGHTYADMMRNGLCWHCQTKENLIFYRDRDIENFILNMHIRNPIKREEFEQYLKTEAHLAIEEEFAERERANQAFWEHYAECSFKKLNLK